MKISWIRTVCVLPDDMSTLTAASFTDVSLSDDDSDASYVPSPGSRLILGHDDAYCSRIRFQQLRRKHGVSS